MILDKNLENPSHSDLLKAEWEEPSSEAPTDATKNVHRSMEYFYNLKILNTGKYVCNTEYNYEKSNF